MTDTKNWVIIGCGYCGTYLARRLLDSGARVVLTRRSQQVPADLAALVNKGASYRSLDLDASPVDVTWLPTNALVVISTPPARQPNMAGLREAKLVAALSGARRVVYLSSTGVYPMGSGNQTTEATPAEPAAAHGIARLAAETAVLDEAARHGIAAVSLRISGIYGPGRGVVTRIHAGSYRIIGDGRSLVSRIHIYDLVSAIIAAATVEPLVHALVNVADDEPCGSLEYARAVAQELGVAEPPIVSISKVDARVAALVGSNRAIANERLKNAFSVSLRYPSWRDSLAELCQAVTS